MRHFHISPVLLTSWSFLVGAQPQTQYIISLEVISSLAPCASAGISQVVQQLTSSACLTPATALASCACTDPQSSAIASSIASNVREGCGTTASEDVNSALTVFSVYCAGGSQTTFPGPTATLTEYINNIQAISSVGQCASSGLVGVVQSLTVASCPAPPTALVSCACFKDNNSAAISAAIQTAVQQSCGTTAFAQVTGAVGVFNAYCGSAGITPPTTSGSKIVSTASLLQSSTAGSSSQTNFQNATSSPPRTSSPNLRAILPGAIIGSILCTSLIAACFNTRVRLLVGSVWARRGETHSGGDYVGESVVEARVFNNQNTQRVVTPVSISNDSRI